MNVVTDLSELPKTTTPPAKPARKRTLLIAALVVAAGLITAGGGLWLRQQTPTVPVLVLYGNVDIREIAPAFNDNGPVTRMLVQEGDRVRKGDLIAEIDNARYAATLATAAQQAENLRQVLARLVNGSRPEEIAQAKAAMQSLEANYENAKISLARAVALRPGNVVSQSTLDSAKALSDSSRESYEAAKQAYILAVKGPREEDIAAARAAVQSAEASLAFAQEQFNDTKLYAPIDGIVEDRILEPGDMASPTTPVYTIALTDPLWVRVYAPETQLGNVKLGMRASIGTDSFPGRTYRGWIGYLSPTAEFTPKTIESPELRTRLVYQLRVYVCDPGGDLRLGMPATVRIDLSQPEPAGKQDPSSPCGADDAPGK
jgi:HlyD family secretion protein